MYMYMYVVPHRLSMRCSSRVRLHRVCVRGQVGSEFQVLTRDNIVIGDTNAPQVLYCTVPPRIYAPIKPLSIPLSGLVSRALSRVRICKPYLVPLSRLHNPIPSHGITYPDHIPPLALPLWQFLHQHPLDGLPVRKGLRPGDVGYDGYNLGLFEGVFDDSTMPGGDEDEPEDGGSVITTSTARGTWRDARPLLPTSPPTGPVREVRRVASRVCLLCVCLLRVVASVTAPWRLKIALPFSHRCLHPDLDPH